MRLLLDSHTIYWSLYEPDRLPDEVKSKIEDPSNILLISHVSALELTDKAAKFRLPMAGFSVDRIVERIWGLGATILPIELDDIVASVKLPRHHGDPMDRFLIAQARRFGATLLSKDGKFNTTTYLSSGNNYALGIVSLAIVASCMKLVPS